VSQFDKLDVYIIVATALFVLFAVATISAAFRGKLPSVQTLQNLATLFNTKGGIIILLVMMWWCTLAGTVSFCVWVVAKGIDPQHPVVVMVLGMLISQAFGNVNGSLFTMFKGEDPKPPAGMSSISTTSSSTTSTLVPSASGGGL
jgi:hypothetical protein